MAPDKGVDMDTLTVKRVLAIVALIAAVASFALPGVSILLALAVILLCIAILL